MSPKPLAKARLEVIEGARGGEGRARRSELMIRMTLWNYTSLKDSASTFKPDQFRIGRDESVPSFSLARCIRACRGASGRGMPRGGSAPSRHGA